MDDEEEVDPRVRRTRRAVLAAARAVLLDEGWEGVTVGRLAVRSGYARTTLYRHWPQRLDLLRDLISEEADLAHTSPTGDLRADLVAELEALRTAMTTAGLGRVMIAIAQHARDDAELADLSRSIRAEGTRVLDAIVGAGVGRGDLAADAASGGTMALLVGPLLFRYLDADDAPTAGFVEDVVDGFLRSHTPPAGARSAAPGIGRPGHGV